jgi:hypothetical protein
MSLFIIFLVCSSSIFDIVMIDDEFMYKFAKCLAIFSRELSGRLHVGMVPRCYLPANVPYWLGHVVVRRSDSFVESYIIQPSLVGQAELVLHGKSCYVLAFFSDVPYT